MGLKELWKTVPDFTDYEVSNTGKIRVVVGIDKKLYSHTNNKKHKIYILTKDNDVLDVNNRQVFSIHQLVAELYLDKVDELDDVKHLDFNESNNNVTNLKWCRSDDFGLIYPIIRKKIKEEWRVVKDYPNYKVSNLGKVKNIVSGNLLSLKEDNFGYIRVVLTNYDGKKRLLVHRLIASAFIPKPIGRDVVNHIDGVTNNNVAINLEWVTHIENVHHAIDTGLQNNRGEDSTSSKLTEKEVICISNKLMNPRLTYKEITIGCGVIGTDIRNIVSGSAWKHITKNYNFPYRVVGTTTREQVLQVCELLTDLNNSTADIAMIVGVSFRVVHTILGRTSHNDISKDYNFPDRSQVKLNDNDVKEVCELLMDKNIPVINIAKQFNVAPATIRSIFEHKTWLHISNDYSFPSRNQEKLTTENVHDICKYLVSEELSRFELAAKFNVSVGVIDMIKNGTRHGSISKLYKFKDKKPPIFTKDNIGKLIEDFKKVPSISSVVLGIKYGVNSSSILKIKARKIHKKLTKDYIW